MLRRGLRARWSREMWSGSRFVFRCSSSHVRKTLFVRGVAVATWFAAAASTFVELTTGNCGANHGGQTCPKHPESIINSCSSVFHFSVRLERDWSSQFTVYRRFLLSSSENIQSPSSGHPIVFTWDKCCCCADVCLESKFHRLVYCCHFHWFLSPWISTFWCHCLNVEVWAVACTNNQRLCVHTFRKFDTHIRVASVLLSSLRRPLPEWLSFPFLPTFLPLLYFSLPFPFRETASTSIESSSCVLLAEVVLKMASAPQVILSRHA